MGFIQAEACLRTLQATPPPAFLFHSQCQTSRGQMGFHPAIRRIRSGHSVAGPVCERAGYKTQSSFPSTAFFELFSATRRRPKNLRKEPTKVSSGPLRGPQATNCGRREEAIYAPPIRHASGFWSKITKPRVFHRTGSLASRTVDSRDCGHELIAEQAPASLYEGFLDNR